MPSVCRHQALKLPDSLPVLPELRGKNGCGAGWGRVPGEDTGTLTLPPSHSPEGFHQGPRCLRRGPEAWAGARAEARGPPQPAPGGEDRQETHSWGAWAPPSACAWLTCLLALPCRVCSPERLLLLHPLQKVLLQRSVPSGAERGHQAILPGFQGPAWVPRTCVLAGRLQWGWRWWQ